MRVRELGDKLLSMETKCTQLKERADTAERDKEQTEIDFQNKIELLKYKLLNKVESDSGAGGEGVGGR